MTHLDLNENEQEVLQAIIDNACDASGGDFACSDELQYYLKNVKKNQISGYVSDLKKKGIIDSADSGMGFSQISLEEEHRNLLPEKYR